MPALFVLIDSPVPSGGAEALVWVLVAALIVGLYLVIRHTRIKSRNHYLDRAKREGDMRKNDPDMKDE
jgi:hypothetical protein